MGSHLKTITTLQNRLAKLWAENERLREENSREPVDETKPIDRQVGGEHYKDMAIQPVEFIHANELGFIEGTVIKYVCRHRSKGGRQDIEKAIHFLQMLLDLDYA